MSTVLKLAPYSYKFSQGIINIYHPKKKKCLELNKEIKQKWIGLGNFEICFCEILTTITKTLFLEGRLGTNICLHPI